jgi:5-methylcytosine-specific restriction endonuclease McrA
MFDFEPLTEDQLIEEAKIESRYHAWRSNEALSIFIELRKELCDAFISLDIVVLKPICLNCRYQLIGQEWPDAPHPEIVRIWPELANGRLRLYEAGNQTVEFWPAEESAEDNDAEFYSIHCYLCTAQINEPGDDNESIPVVPTPFSEHFGLEEEGPRRARGRALKRGLATMYGHSCFQCKQPLTLADVTLDHIVARAHGGEAVPLNLQVLCESCNQSKKDLAVVTMELALDFPLRPAPSDTYEGLIW